MLKKITNLTLLLIVLFIPTSLIKKRLKIKTKKTELLKVDNKSLDSLISKLSYMESRNDWKIVSENGYIGLFQFGSVAIKDLKINFEDKYKSVDILKFKRISKQITLLNKKIKSNPNDFNLTIKLFKKTAELRSIFSEQLQREALLDYIFLTKKYLGDLKPFLGKKIKGIKITESGIIASSHLVGYLSVKKFLNKKIKNIPKDGNGVSFTVYLKEFSGFKI